MAKVRKKQYCCTNVLTTGELVELFSRLPIVIVDGGGENVLVACHSRFLEEFNYNDRVCLAEEVLSESWGYSDVIQARTNKPCFSVEHNDTHSYRFRTVSRDNIEKTINEAYHATEHARDSIKYTIIAPLCSDDEAHDDSV